MGHDGTRASLRCDDSGLRQIRPSSAPAASDRLALVRYARPLATWERAPLPDADIGSGEVSLWPILLPETRMPKPRTRLDVMLVAALIADQGDRPGRVILRGCGPPTNSRRL